MYKVSSDEAKQMSKYEIKQLMTHTSDVNYEMKAKITENTNWLIQLWWMWHWLVPLTQ